MPIDKKRLNPEQDLTAPIAQWIVFSDETDLKFLKILKRGFRHCFMIMQQDGRWVLIDPRSNKTDIAILPHPTHFNFPRYFSEQGKTVVKVPLNMIIPQRVAPTLPMTCVDTMKRLIGLHRRWVLTPYQLFKYLNKKG